MYLTRMPLDDTGRETMKALASPNMFHGAVEHAFQGERQRKLWRLDTLQGQRYLLLLSEEQPDLTAAAQQFGYPQRWETRAYEPLLERIQTGSRWQFRLTANPTYANSAGQRDGRGKVKAHVTTAHQEQWLLRQAGPHGFALAEGEYRVVHRQWYHFRKGGASPRQVQLLAVTYEGALTVTDAERFKRTLVEGLGRGKAYGMGLLTVIRLAER
jgi:CRISPR system Cascade subunit CasE